MKTETRVPTPLVKAIGRPARVANRARQATPAPARRAVSHFCWTVVIGFIAWDVYLAADEVPGNTWSEVMRSAGSRYPMVPWLLGVLLGHLFHPRDRPAPVLDREVAATVLGVLTFGLVGLGYVSLTWPPWFSGSLVLAGVIAGYRLWPMGRKTENWQW